ncbi:MAG: hypothetical protein HC945_02090 [Nitrosarchaeum sp.]|nr:hypothetical protein [Nitrosarchaeum sp.]
MVRSGSEVFAGSIAPMSGSVKVSCEPVFVFSSSGVVLWFVGVVVPSVALLGECVPALAVRMAFRMSSFICGL